MQDIGIKPAVTVNVNVYVAVKQSIPISNKSGSVGRRPMRCSARSAETRVCEKRWVIFAERCKRADESECFTRTQPLVSRFKGSLAFKLFIRGTGIYALLIRAPAVRTQNFITGCF